MSSETFDLFQGKYQDPAVPHWRSDLKRQLSDAFYMRHYPDVFPHDYAAGMCASLAHKLWRASAMSYQDYVRYCNFASKLLGRNLRHLDIQIAYDLAIDVGPTMPEGHERQQESAQIKRTSHDLPVPRPRYRLEAKRPQNSSQRFLRRFNAGDTLADTNTTSRAMNNQTPEPRQLLLTELQGDLFASSPVSDPSPEVPEGADFSVAVLVTPPLSPMGGTFPLNLLAGWSVKGGR